MTKRICTKCGLTKDQEKDFSWSIRGVNDILPVMSVAVKNVSSVMRKTKRKNLNISTRDRIGSVKRLGVHIQHIV
jgi:hypothetical protein